MSDENQGDVVPQADVAPDADASVPAAIEPTIVVARQPSSASETQQPEQAAAVESDPLPLGDAIEALLIFVKGRRTVGDSDLDAAIADVEAALAAQDAQA